MLVRSWAESSGWRERMAWVSVEPVDRDGQRFWLSVIDALGQLTGSERILQQLEEQLELRRTSPTLTGSLHRAAAEWHEREGDIVEAIRHARAAHEWRLVSRLLKAPRLPPSCGCRPIPSARTFVTSTQSLVPTTATMRWPAPTSWAYSRAESGAESSP